MPDDELLVAKRVAQPLVPARLGLDDVEREAARTSAKTVNVPTLTAVSSSITPATHASSSCQRSLVHVREVGALQLLLVRNQALIAVVPRDAAPLLAQLRRRRDHDHLVEPLVAARLVEKRHLGDADLGRVRQRGELLPPRQILGRDPGVQQRLEEVELGAVGEHDLGDPAAVDRAVVREYALPELARRSPRGPPCSCAAGDGRSRRSRRSPRPPSGTQREPRSSRRRFRR